MAVNESSYCFISSSAFCVVSVPDSGHYNSSAMISQCFFVCISPVTCNMKHYFYMLICHLCVFFGEVFFKVFSLFLELFVLLLSFKSALCMLCNVPLSDVPFVGRDFVFRTVWQYILLPIVHPSSFYPSCH